jgi:hypothetical protein
MDHRLRGAERAAVALSQSLPHRTPNEPARVVVSVAVGPPEVEFADRVAPIAPDPFVPLASAPVKLTTVIDADTDCDSDAVTVTLLSADGANARQISDVPSCTFVRATSCQVRDPPVTPVTVIEEAMPSVEMNASSTSFGAMVENALVA